MASKDNKPRTEKNDRGAALGLKQDRLSRQQLQALYGFTSRQLQVDDSLFDLFQRAYDEQWDQARFNSEVEQLDWYRSNQASMREYALLEAEGGADFDAKMQDSYEYVRRTAMQLGVNLSSAQLQQLSKENLMFGWGESGQEYELQQAIVELPQEGQYGGNIRANADGLRALAYANGVSYSDNWYTDAGKNIATGRMNAADFENEIRDQAASKFTAFSSQIKGGMNMLDIASPYTRIMQDEWEIPYDQINLSDPMLLAALTNTNEQGQQVPMNLGDFTRTLRKDPRWMNTDKAQNQVSGIAASVMRMFGMSA